MKILRPLTIRVINTLIYPITFDPHPMRSIEGAIDFLYASRPPIGKEEILSSLDEAINSVGWSDQIAAIGHHTEEDIKEFLIAVRKSIVCS